MKEKSLVAFTIMSQTGAGAFIVLGMLHYALVRGVAEVLTDRALLAIGPIVAVGMLASFFHLGTPMNAWRALANLRSSWLSREVLFALLFTLLGGWFAVVQWQEIGPLAIREVLAWCAACAGLAMIYSMARVYMLRTVPAWNSWATPVSFFATALLLGSLLAAVGVTLAWAGLPDGQAFVLLTRYHLPQAILHWLGLGSFALLGIELIVIPASLAYSARQTRAGAGVPGKLRPSPSWLYELRLVLTCLGAALAGLLLTWNASLVDRSTTFLVLVGIAMTLVFAGEVIGRTLFYTAQMDRGM
jgi:anaerobic dimethyl sulfoxide reductase subunit C (anchor subunit)